MLRDLSAGATASTFLRSSLLTPKGDCQLLNKTKQPAHIVQAAQSVKKSDFAGFGAIAPIGVQGPKTPQYSTLPDGEGLGRVIISRFGNIVFITVFGFTEVFLQSLLYALRAVCICEINHSVTYLQSRRAVCNNNNCLVGHTPEILEQ